MSRRPVWKRLLLVCTLGALAGVVVTWFNPLHSGLLKLALVACVAAAWVGLAILAWPWKGLRIAILSLPILAAIPFLLPGGPMDPSDLRSRYVQRLGHYEGTEYFWGGESPRGIDCSGLPRRALRDALLSYGLDHWNGRAFRTWAEHWWHDASARALAGNYRGYAFPTGPSGTIRKMDASRLVQGDLAVTSNGVHMLAYLGEDRWIQAEPDVGSVVAFDGREDSNRWFDVPVTIHRWRLLADQ